MTEKALAHSVTRRRGGVSAGAKCSLSPCLAVRHLGSNSFRLQICHHQNGQLKVVDSIKEMVRFAAGLDEHKRLDEASQQRALDCLARFGESLRGLSQQQVRTVATNT